MKKIKLSLLVLLIAVPLLASAQQQTAMMEQMKSLTKESDPGKSVSLMRKIIADNKLDAAKDAETIDVLKGTVALAFLRERRYDAFKKYIGEIKNKFNQTSYMNMGASILVRDKIDAKMAEQLAKETIDLYLSYKDDPAARPVSMEEADWKRFMTFAQYPYYDTYAAALFANGKYKEALAYQEKTFDGDPEEGMSSSVERYARLLALTGQQDKAYGLLEALTKKGKATADMHAQLKELYVGKHGSTKGFDEYVGRLEKSVQTALKESLKPKMKDTVAPGFALRDLNGKMVSLSDFRGKVVVLDFWATWCQPCIASFPAMQKMVKQHPEVVFLFIATQEKADGALLRVKSFMEKKKYPFHVLMDEPVGDKGTFQVVSKYKPNGIPAKVVIDGRGRMRFMSTGFSTDSELINELEAMIDLAKEAS
ncbi:redoxin domain-containing protein [Chitinophaga sp. GCM10012297]|uniref:Redoxin domain-containing protein n=1 Tax=Chitinophaga chungangae TaxID=2821488 RepID=A0ABS3YFN0_9BACT|nr:TlpA disulfide reductase family protein [Chitinophaga chungangae]MBO9153492.1 redoxin domain-containing protein [Chitinophaga chungangae]